MPVTAAELRQNAYRLLDEVLDTGVPLEIERKGRRLRLVPADSTPKLDRAPRHPDYISGDPEGLIELD